MSALSSDQMNDLLNFLSSDARPDVRNTALNIITQLSAAAATDHASMALFYRNSNELLVKLKQLHLESPPSRPLTARIFTNLTANDVKIISFLLDDLQFLDCVFEKDNWRSDATLQLISNLTREKQHCEMLAGKFPPDFVKSLIVLLTSTQSSSVGDFAGYVLRNVTQLESVRADLIGQNQSPANQQAASIPTNQSPANQQAASIPTNQSPANQQAASIPTNQSPANQQTASIPTTDQSLISLVYPLLAADRFERKSVAIDVMKNCCFDTHHHTELMNSDEFLVTLLKPLAGPEELDDADQEQLPIDLQYLEATKSRETDLSVRTRILEALYQLCATGVQREHLRKNGAYIILREYHKSLLTHDHDGSSSTKIGQFISDAQISENEPPSSLETAFHDRILMNVINVLIQNEEEIGVEDLKKLDVNSEVLGFEPAKGELL